MLAACRARPNRTHCASARRVGEGTDVHFGSHRITGAALVRDGQVVHLEVHRLGAAEGDACGDRHRVPRSAHNDATDRGLPRPMTSQLVASPGLTDEQRRIVEWGDGPLVVIAGAGTGKTRVIVERVRWLLETHGEATVAPDGSLQCPYPSPDAAATDPFAGPLLPEQILVLTYNVKAARELGERIETRGRPGHPGAPRRQQLPQLLPPRPDRLGGGRRSARAPGRARRCRPAAPAARHPAGPAARSTTRAAARPTTGSAIRGLHQPRQGRARHARTTSTPSRTASARPSRRASGRYERGPRARLGPGQPRAAAQGALRLRRASAGPSAPRRPAR